MKAWIVIASRKRDRAVVARGTWRSVRQEYPDSALYSIPPGYFVDNRTPADLIALADDLFDRTAKRRHAWLT
jgi:hypothetical protein